MMGFNKNKNQESLNISHFSAGDTQIKALASIMKINKKISSFNLKNNRISNLGAEKLISSLNFTIQVLNLSNNRIGYIGA